MKDRNLLERSRKLGFSLFDTEEDANRTLADVARSKELRFWEGFPVLLATSCERGQFDHDKAVGGLKKTSDRVALSFLVAMSLALYKFLDVKFHWVGTVYDLLSDKHKKGYEKFLLAFKNGHDLSLCGRVVSSDGVKSVFRNYFRIETNKLQSLMCAKEEMGVEYALSQVFSPKQKELFLKKLKGELLTKTEKEYFSRSVKKKVLALANVDLHRMALELLGK
ncbi:MAG: hypothetical protein HQL28_01585 [Candidatus Omnitrophica bacterium]|nr:hypothetical protein [Candidatus Omnitrophota bacterium]